MLIGAAGGYAVTNILIAEKWARVTAGVMGIVTGSLTFLLTMFLMIGAGTELFISVGIGAYLMLILSAAMLAAGIMSLLRYRPAQQAQFQQYPPQYPNM